MNHDAMTWWIGLAWAVGPLVVYVWTLWRRDRGVAPGLHEGSETFK